MEQNPVSDEELIERINKVLKESKQDKKYKAADARADDSASENFHDVYEPAEKKINLSHHHHNNNSNNSNGTSNCNSNCNNNSTNNNSGETKEVGVEKSLVLENHYLSLQLQAEKKRAKELQTKFKLFENSVKYFERLNGQLETIKRAVDEDFIPDGAVTGETGEHCDLEMQKIQQKTIHTTAGGFASSGVQDASDKVKTGVNEQTGDETSNTVAEEAEEVAFRDANDFKLLEQGLEIVKDKNNEFDSDTEKVFITKTEKRCLEDIGNLAARTRTPLDDKHQRYFEKDRRKFAHSIMMPDIQEIEKTDTVPPEIISKTNETPVNITSTELDGLRSYLLQLKELIARRETAWARTTERDYNQRVEITRFKNEVGRLRMLCEKRQRDIKERDQIIANKDEEIKELQKRVQGLRNAIVKLERKDDKLMDTIDGMTNEVLENSHLVQRSYNAMKRQSMMNRVTSSNNMSVTHMKSPNAIQVKPTSKSKDSLAKKTKTSSEKTSSKKSKLFESASADDDWKGFADKQKQKAMSRDRSRHRSDYRGTRDGFGEKVGDNLQRVEAIIHNEVYKESARKSSHPAKPTKNHMDMKSLTKQQLLEKASYETGATVKKLGPSNSTIRQEMLTAMTGLNTGSNLGIRGPGFPDPKKNPTATVIANALLAARNSNMFSY